MVEMGATMQIHLNLRFIFAGLVIIYSPAAQTQSLRITEYAWTTGIESFQFVDQLPSQIATQPVYLWMRVKADESALRDLETKGMLPIRHRWVHYLGTIVRIEGGGRLTDEITLGIGTSDVIARLKQKVNKDHFFDWRTWSMKENVRPGEWIVEVIFNDGTPVL